MLFHVMYFTAFPREKTGIQNHPFPIFFPIKSIIPIFKAIKREKAVY